MDEKPATRVLSDQEEETVRMLLELRQHLTDRALAESLGINRKTISKLNHGWERTRNRPEGPSIRFKQVRAYICDTCERKVVFSPCPLCLARTAANKVLRHKRKELAMSTETPTPIPAELQSTAPAPAANDSEEAAIEWVARRLKPLADRITSLWDEASADEWQLRDSQKRAMHAALLEAAFRSCRWGSHLSDWRSWPLAHASRDLARHVFDPHAGGVLVNGPLISLSSTARLARTWAEAVCTALNPPQRNRPVRRRVESLAQLKRENVPAVQIARILKLAGHERLGPYDTVQAEELIARCEAGELKALNDRIEIVAAPTQWPSRGVGSDELRGLADQLLSREPYLAELGE
jgi:hypothetical protein